MSGPLAGVGSIKVKLGLLVAASVVVAALVGVLGAGAGVPVLLAIPVTVALALGVTQLLAVGMTSPLREMTEAARRMARGDYGSRVRADATDEVGQLARAFNQMAAELATVSHELRTPIAGLAAVLENLADGVVPADDGHLDAAVAQARRVSSLVDDLLQLSRVDAGLAPLNLTNVEVAGLVDEVVADLVPTGRGVSFHAVVPDDLRVRADRGRLRQLLVNLLDNAVRHSPERGTVEVSAGTAAGRWHLDVADDGPGIALEDRERAFERFGTLGADPSVPGSGGTGLGLAIARWVATLHTGTVRFVDPPTGRGARVRLDLPLDPPPRPAAVPMRGNVSTDPSEATMTAVVPPAPATHPVDVPPVIDSLFGSQWPDRPGGDRRVVLAAAAVGLLGAVLLPYRNPGLAMFLVLAAAGASVWWAARHRREPFTVTCMVLAALCCLPVVLLDADWIAALCVVAGVVSMIIGATRGSRIPEFLVAGICWPLSGLRGLPWLGRSVHGLLGGGRAPRVVLTILWSVLGVLVFGLLLGSADAVMAGWLDNLLPDLTLQSFVFRCFVGVAVGGASLGAAYLALNPPDVSRVPGRTARPSAHRFEWLVPVLLVDAVFVTFVAAQAAVLFGGHDYVQRTTGLTYADYVHQGFGQLTIATLLMLLVVWAAGRRVGPSTADRLWMRVSSGLLCAMTLVVVVSALHRMHLYQQAYGFTRTRLLVDVFEGWLGVVVLGVIVAGLVRWGLWLPRFALVTGVVGLLGIAAINPDAWIAGHNIDRYEQSGKLDWQYLATLSSDAVPTLHRLPPDLRDCVLSYSAGNAFDDDWLTWNLGRARARHALGGHLPSYTQPVTCPGPSAQDTTG